MRRTLRLTLIGAMLLAGVVIAPVLANFQTLYARVYDDRRFPALSRYELERTPDVALVGSSMTYRLYEGYFKTRLRNISISGGSPLTGLAIIASYPSLPRIVLVETNIMSRPMDAELVEKFGGNDTKRLAWFRPYRAVISFVYSWFKNKSESDNVTQLPQQPPADYDISESVRAAEAEYTSTKLDQAMAANTEAMKQLTENLESRGCRIYLFELPYPGNLGNSHFAKTARSFVRTAFPNPKQWLTLDLSRPELRWLDAAHMDERSAILMAREIDALKELE